MPWRVCRECNGENTQSDKADIDLFLFVQMWLIIVPVLARFKIARAKDEFGNKIKNMMTWERSSMSVSIKS